MTVLLLEAGEEGDSLFVNCPMGYVDLQLSSYDWQYTTTPQVHMRGRVSRWPRGKVLGGCSAINAMLWVRGAPACFDQWAALGCAGWSSRDVEPVFRAIEAHVGGAAAADHAGT